ncbi:MAG: AbiU2 domain-containing protein [Thiobacillus sp.]
MKLSGDKIREELFRRIDAANAQHEMMEGFRIALLDAVAIVAYNKNVRFFGTVELSLFYALVVLLYSFYETRPDTVSFKTLLDSVENKKGLDSAKTFRDRIADLKPYVKKINILRNEAVGHQSTGRPLSDTHTRANLAYSDVEVLLAQTKQLFQDVSSQHFDISSSFREDSHLAAISVLVALKPEGVP